MCGKINHIFNMMLHHGRGLHVGPADWNVGVPWSKHLGATDPLLSHRIRR